MWKCRACGLHVMFQAVTPEVDEVGLYFVCHGCEQRNPLVNLGDQRGMALAQPDQVE